MRDKEEGAECREQEQDERQVRVLLIYVTVVGISGPLMTPRGERVSRSVKFDSL